MPKTDSQTSAPTIKEKLEYTFELLRSLILLASEPELRALKLYLEMALIEAQDARERLESEAPGVEEQASLSV